MERVPQASHSSNMFTSPGCHRLSVSQAKITFIRKYYWAIYIRVFFVLLFLLLPLGSEANPSHLTSPDFGKVHVQKENRGRAANAQRERGWCPTGSITAGTAQPACAQSSSDPRHPAPWKPRGPRHPALLPSRAAGMGAIPGSDWPLGAARQCAAQLRAHKSSGSFQLEPRKICQELSQMQTPQSQNINILLDIYSASPSLIPPRQRASKCVSLSIKVIILD